MKEKADKDKPTLTWRLKKLIKIARLTIMPTIKADLKEMNKFKKSINKKKNKKKLIQTVKYFK